MNIFLRDELLSFIYSTHKPKQKSETRRLRNQWYVRLRKMRPAVLAKTNAICIFCGEPADTIDHFIPLVSLDPSVNDFSNLMPACDACNKHKADRMPEEYRAVRAFYADSHGSTFVILGRSAPKLLPADTTRVGERSIFPDAVW